MKRLTLCLLALAGLAALPALAIVKAGSAIPDRGATAHRCNADLLAKGVADRAGQGGTPLCNQDVWSLIDKDKKLKAQWDAGKPEDRVKLIKTVDDMFFLIDSEVDAVLGKAEDVLKSAESLGIAVPAAGSAAASVKPNAQGAKGDVATVTDVQFPKKETLVKDGLLVSGLSAGDQATAVSEIAQGPDGQGKDAKQVRPGKKIVAYLQETEKLRGILVKLQPQFAGAMTPPDKPIPADSADWNEINSRMTGITHHWCSVGMVDAECKPLKGGPIAYYDKETHDLLSHYESYMENVFKQMTGVAALTVDKTPDGLKSHLEGLAKMEGERAAKVKDMNLEAYKKAFGDKMAERMPEGATGEVVDIGKGGKQIGYKVTDGQGKTAVIGVHTLPEVKADSKAEDLAAQGSKVAETFINDGATAAQLKALGLAFKGVGAPKEGDPKTLETDKTAPLGPFVGPSPITGLQSGCGKGQTLADAIKEKQDARRSTDAKQSAERRAVEKQYGDKLTAVENEYPLPRRESFESPQAYEQREDVKQIRRQRKAAIDEANAWYAKEQDRLGSEEKQGEDLAADLDKIEQDEKQALKTQTYIRIGQLRTKFAEDGRTGEKAALAKQAIRAQAGLPGAVKVDDQWIKDVNAGVVKSYFDAYWPEKEAGKNADEVTGTFQKKFGWCYPSQVRKGHGEDVDNCVGRLMAYYLKDYHHETYEMPAPTVVKPETDFRTATLLKKRCTELQGFRKAGKITAAQEKEWTDKKCVDVLGLKPI
ncbi:MAG: hypothetical protein HY077_04665 [Elusimicrobia bacterium]|nr:hypothetical protein [Elusimicrobiota bacterium]